MLITEQMRAEFQKWWKGEEQRLRLCLESLDGFDRAAWVVWCAGWLGACDSAAAGAAGPPIYAALVERLKQAEAERDELRKQMQQLRAQMYAAVKPEEYHP